MRLDRTVRRRPAPGGRSFLMMLALAALPVVAGCHHAPPRTSRDPSVLRVGIATVYPPLAFEENGEIKGVEVDFAHQLAKDLGLELTFVELPWTGLIPALTEGRVDVIMSGMSITEDRSKLVDFTQPYLRVGQMALIRKADYQRLRGTAAMNQPTSRVGFQTGTTGEAFVRRKLTQAQLKGFPTPEEGIAALRAGEIDFFVHDAPTIWRETGGFDKQARDLMGRYTPLTEEYLAWAVRKDDQPLRDRLNTELLHWRENGQLEVFLDHWIRVRKVTIDINSPPE